MDDKTSPYWYAEVLADLSQLNLNGESDTPLYRQLAQEIERLIVSDALEAGDRLPPTRELAGQLGLNRTTISAAYEMLERSGLIEGQVGRGSFVAKASKAKESAKDWDAILPPTEPGFAAPAKTAISFASSQPAGDSFPLAVFRRLAKQVIDGPNAGEILQLGAPHGYGPLRHYLLQEATTTGVARAADDLIVTSGCQQALDLLARLTASGRRSAIIEDPVYHGLLRTFARGGVELLGVPVDEAGIDVDALERLLEQQRARPASERSLLLIVTPSFQNPTGATLPLERRKHILELVRRFGLILVENDIYSELRYRGTELPTLKELDESGNTILLRSYSKVAFPGLRIGWVIAPRPVIARLAEAKQATDLHSDQLSQAVLLRLAQSGELGRHLERMKLAGAERLDAVLEACARYLPRSVKFTRPEGGMSLWMELPPPLVADALLHKSQEHGVTFLPGPNFSVRRAHIGALRISFGALAPEQIRQGIQILGELIERELASQTKRFDFEPAVALV